MSAYQDLMTALVTRQPDQSAAVDEQVVLAALANHTRELADRLGDRYSGTCGCGCDCSAYLDDSAGPVRPGEEPTP